MKLISEKVMNILVSLFLILLCGVVAAFACASNVLGFVLLALDIFLLGAMSLLKVEELEEDAAK